MTYVSIYPRLLAQLGLLGGSTGALAEQQPPVAKRAKQPTAKKSRRTSHLTDENAHLYLRRSSRRKDAVRAWVLEMSEV